MDDCGGARNTIGFSNCIQSGEIPDQNHITFEGIFNELKFDVGNRCTVEKDIHFGYARYEFKQSCYDNQIHDYLALILKSKKDGADRDERPLNAIICLDISGSMNSRLEGSNGQKSRLALSVEAIKMFISKLRPNDSLGLVTFDDTAHVIFPPAFKKEIHQNINEILDKIEAYGGTTIRSGFQCSKALLDHFILKNQCIRCENRIIMLTDVCDNSLINEAKFIEEASKSKINLTIIGISQQFKSEVCQKLKNIQGFNYFCAITQNDLQKYVFETFDFGFFAAAYDLNITIQSEDIESFEVFGATDCLNVPFYNDDFKGHPTNFVITKMSTSFPSQIEIQKDTVYTYGGLILLKMKRNSKNSWFKGEIQLSYKNLDQEKIDQQYKLCYEFDPEEQFFSEDTVRTAIEGYIFAAEMKHILRQSKIIPTENLSKLFLPALLSLRKITPEAKLKDLENMIKMLNSLGKQSPEQEIFINQ